VPLVKNQSALTLVVPFIQSTPRFEFAAPPAPTCSPREHTISCAPPPSPRPGRVRVPFPAIVFSLVQARVQRVFLVHVSRRAELMSGVIPRRFRDEETLKNATRSVFWGARWDRAQPHGSAELVV
jgi:hypothetical protein